MDYMQRLKAITERLEGYDTVLTRFVEQVPLVLWCKRYDKEHSGTYVFISNKYGKIYNLDPQTVIGKTDNDIWPEEVAQTFRRNDLSVLRSGREMIITEQAVTPHTKGTEWDNISVIKFPICDPNGVCNMVGGVAFPELPDESR